MSESTTPAPSTRARISAQQIAEHERLVRWVVRQQRLAGLPFEDALHEGRIALWSALRHFDPRRGTAFSSYAVPAIAHAVWHAVGAHRQPLAPIPCAPCAVEEPLALVHRHQVYAALYALVGQLPTRLGQIIVNHYGLAGQAPQSFALIGRDLGVSRQRVQVLHVAALLWLAHPAHSLPLRLLLERHHRADYQRAIARQHELARQRRRPSPAVRPSATERRPTCSS